MITVFDIALICWCVSIGLWLYTIINKKQREKSNYIYPLISMYVWSLIIYLSNIIK